MRDPSGIAIIRAIIPRINPYTSGFEIPASVRIAWSKYNHGPYRPDPLEVAEAKRHIDFMGTRTECRCSIHQKLHCARAGDHGENRVAGSAKLTTP